MKKIIILNNLKVILEQQRNVLAREGLRVFTASSAEEILTLHRKEQADLIITDLESQGKGGEGLCGAIRGDDNLKEVSIIMVYDPESADVGKYKACGANMFIEKPIDQGLLSRKIAEYFAIAERESMRELIKVSVKVSSGEESFFASSLNISISGMLVEGDKILSRGDRVSCSFYLDRQVTLEGTIIRAVQIKPDIFHYGIRFSTVDPESRLLIEEFIEGQE